MASGLFVWGFFSVVMLSSLHHHCKKVSVISVQQVSPKRTKQSYLVMMTIIAVSSSVLEKLRVVIDKDS